MKKMKSVVAVILLVSLLVLSLAGCGGSDVTFGEWSDNELFTKIPAMNYDGNRIGTVTDYGDKNYVVDVSGTSLENYQKYLKRLESNGFKKYADNGENGIANAVYTAVYTKGEMVVTVSHIDNMHKTYISANEKGRVSPHMLESNADKTQISGMKNTLYNLQSDGNAFLLQLKNGHFILNDGGSSPYMKKIVELMEELAPNGEKPIVDAWFFSHEHPDHADCLKQFAKDPDLADRVVVESVYVSEISADFAAIVYGGSSDVGTVTSYVAALKNSAGEIPTVYRPHAGERYYFNDVVIEVPYTQEQHPIEEYEGDLNGSSTWLMYYIDGQKFMLNGDTERNNVNSAAAMYNQEYFDVDLMAVFHHGHNIHAGTELYFNAEVLLYPAWGVYDTRWGPLAIYANNIMMSGAQEAVSYLDGGVKYVFPYEVGSYEILPNWYPDLTAENNEKNGDYAAAKMEDRTYLNTHP